MYEVVFYPTRRKPPRFSHGDIRRFLLRFNRFVVIYSIAYVYNIEYKLMFVLL